jgi:hypothetical protein
VIGAPNTPKGIGAKPIKVIVSDMPAEGQGVNGVNIAAVVPI